MLFVQHSVQLTGADTYMNEIPDNVHEIDWNNWEPEEKAVIVYIVVKDKVLLIHKKTGLGAGKINAPGGRIEKGESPEEAAVRECIEETGVTPLNIKKGAELSFIFKDGYSLFGHVFIADSYEGELTETEEADPFFCLLDEIPYDRMWEDDIYWLPDALKGNFAQGWFIFDSDRMISKKIDLQIRNL